MGRGHRFLGRWRVLPNGVARVTEYFVGASRRLPSGIFQGTLNVEEVDGGPGRQYDAGLKRLFGFEHPLFIVRRDERVPYPASYASVSTDQIPQVRVRRNHHLAWHRCAAEPI